MKKTLSINISGILFHIEEDGYDTLKNYLESINSHFSGYADSKEIISDIENRIAEIFLSYLKNNNQVITAENVTRLIEKMGTIADFSALEEKEEVEEVSEQLREAQARIARRKQHFLYQPPGRKGTQVGRVVAFVAKQDLIATLPVQTPSRPDE
jgi:tRNA G37 N-methylase Trm5